MGDTAIGNTAMKTVNLCEARTQFSRLVNAAAKGEEIIIAKAGKPTARLVSLSTGADVVVSGDVLADPEVAELGLRREPVEAALKGFEESFELWRVR